MLNELSLSTVQHIALDLVVDLDACHVAGVATIRLQPPPNSRQVVRLHCRQCQVSSVTVDGHKARFQRSEGSLSRVVVDAAAVPGGGEDAQPRAEAKRWRDLQLYALNYRGDTAECASGELIVQVPQAVAESTAGDASPTFTVVVRYSLVRPTGCARFVQSPRWTPGTPKHYFIAGGSRHPCEGGAVLGGSSGPRTWFPCVDTLDARTTVDIHVTPTSKHFKDAMVIASGDVEPITRDAATGCLSFTSRVSTAVPASSISVVAGHFIVLSGGVYTYTPPKKKATAGGTDGGADGGSLQSTAAASTASPSSSSVHGGVPWPGEEFVASSTQPIPAHSVVVSHFAPPAYKMELAHTTARIVDTKAAIRFMEEYLQSRFPFNSYKQVFVPGASAMCTPFAGGALCSVDMLHSARAIDPSTTARRHQLSGIAGNWFGCAIGLEEWSDLWLQVGLSLFLADRAVLHLNGNNDEEERLRTYHSMDAIAELEAVTPGPAPLAPRHALRGDPLAAVTPQWYQLLRLKAPIVITMLQRIVRPQTLRRALQALLAAARTQFSADATMQPPPLHRSASTASAAGETPSTPTRLGTVSFIEFLRLIGGADAHKLQDQFVERWIHGTGVPLLRCTYHFDRRRNEANIRVEQLPPHAAYYGKLEFNICELEDFWAYERDVRSAVQLFKIKSFRTGRVRKRRRQPGKASAASDAQRSAAKAGGEESKDNDTPFLFVQVDPNFMWIRRVQLVQDEVMWRSQLRTADVVGKLEALSSLARVPAPADPFSTTAAALIRACLLDKKDEFGYRVRAAAAVALAKWQNLHAPSLALPGGVGGPAGAGESRYRSSWDGLRWLLAAFVTLFCDAESGTPTPYRFDSRAAYELRKALVSAIASVRDAQGVTPLEVLEFCVTVLHSHDNTGNAFDVAPVVVEMLRGLTAAMHDTHLERSASTTGDRGGSEGGHEEQEDTLDDLAVPQEGEDDDDDGGAEEAGADGKEAAADGDEGDGDDEDLERYLLDGVGAHGGSQGAAHGGDEGGGDEEEEDDELDPFADLDDINDADEGDDDDNAVHDNAAGGDNDEVGGAAGPSPLPVASPASSDALPVASPASSGMQGDGTEEEDDGSSIELDSDDEEVIFDEPMDGTAVGDGGGTAGGGDGDAVTAGTNAGSASGNGTNAGGASGNGTKEGGASGNDNNEGGASGNGNNDSGANRGGEGADEQKGVDHDGDVVMEIGRGATHARGPRVPSLASDSDGEAEDEEAATLVRERELRVWPLASAGQTRTYRSAKQLLGQGWRHLRRCLSLQESTPSFRGLVLSQVLASLATLEGALKVPPRTQFGSYVRPQYPARVRASALCGLIEAHVVRGPFMLRALASAEHRRRTSQAYGVVPDGVHLQNLVTSVDDADAWARSLAWTLGTALSDTSRIVRRTVLLTLLQTHVGSRPRAPEPPWQPGRRHPPIPQKLLRRLGAWCPIVPVGGALSPLASPVLYELLPPRSTFASSAAAIVNALWFALNTASAFDWELRLLTYHLYHSIWGAGPPPLHAMNLSARDTDALYAELVELAWLRERAMVAIDADMDRVKFPHTITITGVEREEYAVVRPKEARRRAAKIRATVSSSSGRLSLRLPGVRQTAPSTRGEAPAAAASQTPRKRRVTFKGRGL